MKHIKLFENFLTEAEDGRVTLNVQISNIDQETADDFVKMFAFMQWTGAVGAGRSFKAYFDGDGHFRPKITIDGKEAIKLGDFSKDWDDNEDGIELGFGA